MFLKSLYLIIQRFLWDEIKNPIQYGRIMKKKQRNNFKSGVEVGPDD
jgi:hypothetical protein